MRLHDLLNDYFTSSECERFLVNALDDVGRDVWRSTKESGWTERSFAVAESLRMQGLVNRHFFESLVRTRPGRADDIAAACRHETNQPLNYAVGDTPPESEFPWADYKNAMTPDLIRFLRLAAYDARSRGYTTISTTEVFRVYRALQPWIAVVFPNGTNIAVAPIEKEEDFDDMGASYCLSKTMHGLAAHTEIPKQFNEHDVFLDLVRFGSGRSVGSLVPDGSTLEHVNNQSRQLGIGRISRHGALD